MATTRSNRTETALLIERAQSGDDRAAERLLAENEPLVAAIARRYASPQAPIEDLLQEGRLGLLIAIRKFDPSRGCRLSTMAVPWIRQYVSRYVASHTRVIALPSYLAHAAAKLDLLTVTLHLQLGREPTVAEIAAAAGLSEKQAEALFAVRSGPLSLEYAEEGEEDGCFGDVLPAEDDTGETVLSALDRRALWDAVQSLPPPLAAVIALRYGVCGQSEHTLEEVKQMLGMSARESVRFREKKALVRLRALLEEEDGA